MKVPDPQNLPGTPSQVAPAGFNLTYFFQQWAILAQVINNHFSVLTAIIAFLNGLPGPPTPQTLSVVQTDKTGTNTIGGGPYTNSSSGLMIVSGAAKISSGSGDSILTCKVGSLEVFAETIEATIANSPVGFSFPVPPGASYQITGTNLIVPTPHSWVETVTTLT